MYKFILATFLILAGSAASAHVFQCVGTEPGWAATINQNRGTIRIVDAIDPDKPATVRAKITAAAGRNLENAFAAVSKYLTMSVIHTGSCSDGMSDRVYPMAAMIHGYRSKVFGGAPLEGCCYRVSAE